MIEHLEQTDVLVIGGGLAAMYAAVHAAKTSRKVLMISKKKVGLSGSSLVSMSVHRYAPQTEALKEEYAGGFKASGRGINDPRLMERLVQQGAGQVAALKEFGLPLQFKTRDYEGKAYPYLACCAPKFGRNLTYPMRQYIESRTNIDLLEGFMAVELVTDQDQVKGVVAEKGNALYFIQAKAVVLATGGAGYVFENTSNTCDLTGDGYAMAIRAGLELQDMEFIQFYPYRAYSPAQFDIFPDIFAHGACFLNEKGERFMAGYPKKEQENRDVLARCMFSQKEVILELSGCDPDYLEKECPNIYEAFNKYRDRRFLVKPVAHFMMGGIPLRLDCSTNLKGLYCCGEVTGGMHGANRMAGSALTEIAVFGPVAGVHAAEFAARQCKGEVDAFDEDTLAPELGQDEVSGIRQALRKTMWTCVSLVRTGQAMNGAQKEIDALEKQLMQIKPMDLRPWFECRNMLTTAKCILGSAILRRESRGAHFREDFPAEDPEWTGNILATDRTARFIKAKVQ